LLPIHAAADALVGIELVVGAETVKIGMVVF
jgi:hypothetical protein